MPKTVAKRKLGNITFQDGKVMSASQVKPRVGRDAEVTKGDILLAAMHEFSEYGDSGARIDRIAHRANANKSLIYSYFGNKEELYAHVLREAYIQIRSGESELDLDHLDPREAIRQLMQFTMDHYLNAPWFLRLLATENLRRGQTVRQIEDISELQSPLIQQLSRVLKRGAEQNIFRADVDPVDLYILLASFFYFPISNAYTLPVVFAAPVTEPAWLKRHLDHAQEMVLGHLEKKT
jgi:AcrR family transcriptional regulator